MQVSVSQDRNLYTGGSDIPIIMGISPFKKRFDLLLEKAGLQENTFEGNEYTEYGNVLEPKIRDWINENIAITPDGKYKEDKLIVGDVRCHYDGINEGSILEIKTTSQIHESVDEYMVYLVQLLFYMHYSGKENGLLAVYERPEDFNVEFDKNRLHLYQIRIEDYKDLVETILKAVEQFKIDLERLKEDPMLSEEDLMPMDIQELSNNLVKLEEQLSAYDIIKKQYDDIKKKLYDAMESNNIKKWELNNGTKITKVDATEDKVTTIQQFNQDKFKEENEELFNKYVEDVEKISKGRAGYLKITLPKEEVAV